MPCKWRRDVGFQVGCTVDVAYHPLRIQGIHMSVTSSSIQPNVLVRAAWRVFNVLQLLFTLLWTGLLIPIALLLLLLCGGRRLWPLRMASRVWAPGLLGGAGARLHIDGIDEVDFSQPYIVVANHQSIIDICALFRAFPVPLRFVMKQEMARVPLVGLYARAMGMVFIERSHAREADRRLHAAAKLFQQGHSLCAFPEGTRSRDGRVGPFRGGVFKLAIDTGIPILPAALDGSGGVLPAHGFRVRPGRISVRVGKPIQTDQLSHHDRHQLMQHAHDAVRDLLRSSGDNPAP